MNRRLIGAALIVFGLSASGDPKVAFVGDGISINGVRPGSTIAWIAVARDNTGYYNKLRVHRGFAIATPHGAVSIAHGRKEGERSTWLFSGVDDAVDLLADDALVHVPSPQIEVSATVGSQVIQVRASRVELLYLEKNHHVWYSSTSDGSAGDADGQVDGVTTIPLQALKPLHAAGFPPTTVSVTDRLLVLNPVNSGLARVEVRN